MNLIYLAKRLVIAFVSLYVVASIVFLITHILPGSAANIILGQAATEESIAQVEAQYGLDRPLWEQYVDFVVGVFLLDFGNSFITGRPVTEMIINPFIRTLEMAIVAMIMSIVVAIPMGVIGAAKRDSKLDSFMSGFAYIGVSIPEFVSASLLLLLLATPPLSLFPSGGYTAMGDSFLGWLHHLILPAVALNLLLLAYIMRQTRSSMIETLESDYIRTARLKGVKEFDVLFKHALRNGLLPTITVLAFNFGWMMGSVVIVEAVFDYPGLGLMLVDAIQDRDLPIIQAAILIPTAAFILANLAADILYTVFDPRIELGEG